MERVDVKQNPRRSQTQLKAGGKPTLPIRLRAPRPPVAVEGPPLRRQGAEPLITIFLVSGSTIRVDRTWVRGDHLFYTSRGVGGSVALRDVSRVENLMVKLRTTRER